MMEKYVVDISFDSDMFQTSQRSTCSDVEARHLYRASSLAKEPEVLPFNHMSKHGLSMLNIKKKT